MIIKLFTPTEVVERKTKTITDNGFSPIWNEVIFAIFIRFMRNFLLKIIDF